eukprot:jgi/Bigna1/84991/estExt_fgenesh1_pg.C_10545
MPATTCFRLPLFLVVLFMSIDQTSSMNAKGVNFSFKGLGSVEAVYGVLSRVLKRDAKLLFDLKFTDRCGEKHRDQSMEARNIYTRIPLLYTLEGTESGRSELCFEILNGTAPVSGDATEANLHHRIRIRATSGPDLAYGCAHYLRQRAHLSFSWNRTGGNIIGSSLLADWPPHVPEDLEVRYRRVDISYFMNVVTFSYTFAFYGFREWEALLDWAALSGINLGLAYTGQEEVYRKTFSKFGVNDTAFLPWVNGPAYLAWSRGQSIHGVAESPPISWLQDQWRLQKRILGRMREIGIVAVLPAFQGNVPPVMKELFPRANISVRSDGLAAWSPHPSSTPSKAYADPEIYCVIVLAIPGLIDALDPLFSEIGNAFLRNLINDFGTDHWYEADGYFNTQESPWLLQHSSKKNADHAREHHHPRAKQGGGAKAPWQSPDDVPIDQNAYLRARSAYAPMKNVDPDAGNFVVLDMYDEEMEQWELFNDFSYFDAPFIWSVLHNFGGNTGMWGSIPLLNSRPFRAFENRNNSVAGTGFAPEGFDQNPPYYTFITDVNWMEEPCTDLQQWWKNYAAQRYGLIDDDGGDKGGGDDDDVIRGSTSRGHSASPSPALPLLQRAWIILGNSVYGKDQPSVQEQGFMCEKAREGLTVLTIFGAILNSTRGPTTWEPQQKGSTQLTGIVDYANKHWGGLVGSFYRGRTKCYIDQYMEDFCGGDDDSCSAMDIAGEGTSASFNKTSYIKRVAEWSYQWTHDFGARRYPLCAYDEVKHVAALSSASSSTATTRKLDREGSTNYGIIGGQRIDNDDDTGDNDNTALAVPAAVSISRRLISKYSACVEDPQQC